MNDSIHLSGVELRRHADPDYPVDDPAFEPYAHQQELCELFRTRESFLAVNDSPTGGGKTMSWLGPAVESGENVLAVYPTNALIHDQERNLRGEFAETFTETDLGSDTELLTITADSLRSEYADAFPEADTNGERLRGLLRRKVYQRDKQVIVLTNPDIFVMMRRHLYGREGNPGANVRELNEFETIVVDEFHRAGRKEQNTLLFLLDEMYDLAEHECALSRIVLLSATPTDRLERRFADAMSPPYVRVTQQRETVERRPFDEHSSAGWGAVMPPVDLDVRTASTFGTVDELLGDDWEATREFAGRDGKTVFILDGIREVDDVYSRLGAELDDQTVVRIDGFHRGDLREKLETFDVLVSNSAVEVGIDFTVDRLVFSAHDRASFLQRLGRLRTETERQPARCYVPSTVARALDDLFEDSVDRPTLAEALEDAYRDPRNRESFDWRYSAAEAHHHIRRRARDAPPERAERIREQGWKRITDHFAPSEGLTREDVERYADVVEGPVEDALRWYRGDSLQALVYDRRADTEEPMRSYDLFYLLRHGDVTFYPRSEFDDIVPAEHHSAIDRMAPYVSGFCTYDGTIPPTDDGYGRDVVLKATPEIYGWVRGDEPEISARTPRVVDNLDVDIDVADGSRRLDSIEHLRNGMDDLGLLCYIVDDHPRKAKNRYDLGPFFFLYGIQVADEVRSIALGTDALYLHCAVKDERDAGGLERFGVDI